MIEFERRFFVSPALVLSDLKVYDVSQIKQGYICSDENSVVRIRRRNTKHSPPSWYITIKTNMDEIGKVNEFEYSVPDASDLFSTLTQKIEKTRYVISLHDKKSIFAELDIFHGIHDGLVIVEVELNDEMDSEWLTNNKPSWFGEEITHRKEYSNFNLCKFGLPKDHQ